MAVKNDARTRMVSFFMVAFGFLFLECYFLLYFGFTLSNSKPGSVTFLKHSDDIFPRRLQISWQIIRPKMLAVGAMTAGDASRFSGGRQRILPESYPHCSPPFTAPKIFHRRS